MDSKEELWTGAMTYPNSRMIFIATGMVERKLVVEVV